MSLPLNWPASLDALANPDATTYADDAGFELDLVIARIHDLLELVEAKVGISATTPARGTALIGSTGGVGIWDRYARKNLLVGGSAQLWDQGTSPACSDNAYIGGNWRVLMEAANACTITRESTDLPTSGARWAWKVIAGSGVNNKFGLFQVIEGGDIWDIRAAVASLQAAIKIGGTLASMKAAICVWTGTEDATTADPISAWGAAGVTPTLAANWAYVGTPADLSATTSWVTYFPTANGAISSSATNLAVFVWTDDKTTTQTTDFFLLTDVQLERGIVSTAVERVSKALHQQMDSRFYRKSYDETTVPGTATTLGDVFTYIDQFTSLAGRSTSTHVGWPTPMRAIPVVVVWDPVGGNNKAYNSSGASVTPTQQRVGMCGFNVQTADGSAQTVGGNEFHYEAKARI